MNECWVSGAVVGIGGKGSSDFYMDTDGASALFIAAGGGGYAVFTAFNVSSGGISGVAINNANVDDLNRWSVQMGGSGKLVGGISAEWIIGRNAAGQNWNGVSVGSTSGYGLEVHSTATYSWMFYRSAGSK